ncbi:MAG TPA: hypothetical protein VKU60_12570 [Chloroflexota bacterium]|nr:hypothetical protein [Chloroflexota bacterium]
MGGSVIELQRVLLGLQLFQVAFLWLHDWVPLGRLNDVAAVRRHDSLPRLVVVTLLQAMPWTVSRCSAGGTSPSPTPRRCGSGCGSATVCSS